MGRVDQLVENWTISAGGWLHLNTRDFVAASFSKNENETELNHLSTKIAFEMFSLADEDMWNLDLARSVAFASDSAYLVKLKTQTSQKSQNCL